MTDQTIDILVIDDDDITSEMIERSLRKVEGNFRVVSAEDGIAALDVLEGKSDRKLANPCIILLDLNMPRMNGFEFLENVRANKMFKDKVIFVLTTSDADSDKTRAYNEQVAGYMVKSCVGPQFSHVARLLSDYQKAVTLSD